MFLVQDKMLTRVETARKEMQHIGDFDYGESYTVVSSPCQTPYRHFCMSGKCTTSKCCNHASTCLVPRWQLGFGSELRKS